MTRVETIGDDPDMRPTVTFAVMAELHLLIKLGILSTPPFAKAQPEESLEECLRRGAATVSRYTRCRVVPIGQRICRGGRIPATDRLCPA